MCYEKMDSVPTLSPVAAKYANATQISNQIILFFQNLLDFPKKRTFAPAVTDAPLFGRFWSFSLTHSEVFITNGKILYNGRVPTKREKGRNFRRIQR